MERFPAPVTVNAKLPVVKDPDATKEKDPCAPRKVPVPEVMFAVPESEVEDAGVTMELAVQVLPSPNVTTKPTPSVPPPAWVPFTVFFFGIHESAAIFLIAFGAFFPITMNVAAGARQTPRTLVRAALMLGTPKRKLLWRVVLPSTLPSVFAGLRIGLGLAWVLVIVAEMLAVQGGLGYALWSAYQVNRLDLIMDAIVSVGLLGLLSDWLLVSLSSSALRWQRGLIGQ